MRIRTGIIFVAIAIIVLLIVAGFLARRSPEFNPNTDGEAKESHASIALKQKEIEDARQQFLNTVLQLRNLDGEHRAAQFSLYWDLYILASGGKYDEFLVKWVDESILLTGSRLDADEPLDQMSKRFEKIKKRFAECLESIDAPLTPEMRAMAAEKTQYTYIAVEEFVIEFLNHVKRVKIPKWVYEHEYQSKATSAIGDDLIKGVSSALFYPGLRTKEIIIGVPLIASLRNRSKEEIKNRARSCLDFHLKAGGLISESDEDCLILFMPEANGGGLVCAATALLLEYKKTETKDLVGKMVASSQGANMANEEYVVFDRSAVFPHKIPTVEKGGIRSYPLSQ